MSLTRMQRDAMVRAQRGDWELADALEVANRTHPTGATLLGGIRIGGRLQFFAWGQWQEADDAKCEECTEGKVCDACQYGVQNTELVTDLNDRIVWEGEPGDDETPSQYLVDITPNAAMRVLDAYLAEIANPIQTTLIPEAA